MQTDPAKDFEATHQFPFSGFKFSDNLFHISPELQIYSKAS